MVVIPILRIGHHRRFTANHTWHVDWRHHPLFVKANPHHTEALQEVAGHATLRRHYPVPVLRGVRRVPGWTVLVYDRWPHLGTDQGLLVDEIAHADLNGDIHRLDACLTDIFTCYQRVLARTAREVTFADTVSKLYGDRAAPGGRLERYYQHNTPWPLGDNGDGLRPCDLSAASLVVNGRTHHLDLTDLLTRLRIQFASHNPVWAAITQGDPTDLNIAWSPQGGPLWFDYDTAGLNALPGEFACFLLYQRWHGAWLTPIYNPAAFRDHPTTLAAVELAAPEVHTEHNGHRLAIDYRHTPSPARRHVLHRYLHELLHPLANHLGVTDLMTWLRPYLVMRLLAVYHLAELAPRDAALSLALLVEALHPTTTLPDFLALTPPTRKQP